MFLTGLERILKQANVDYTVVPGAESRTAHRGGLRGVTAQMYHTTETKDSVFDQGGDAPTLSYVVDGLGYPLYNILYGRSGHAYIVACGTAGHAGRGSGFGMPKDQGNYHSVAHSADSNSGRYPITAAQLDSMARVAHELDNDWKNGLRDVMHGEWAPGRRSDPTRVPGGWPALRRAVKAGEWDGSGKATGTEQTAKEQDYMKRDVIVDDAEVMDGRGSNGKVIGTPSKGYTMNVVADDGSWTKVRWNYGTRDNTDYRNAWIAARSLEKPKGWPFEDLPKTGYHTSESHNAWVELLAAINYEDEKLGKNLQSWLNNLTDPRTGKGYYDLNVYYHDGIMGPVAVKGLQRKLYDTSAMGKKHLYYGMADGDRGKLTIHAEIDYLNWQRQFLI